jgi:hypothetical protein
LCDDVQLCNRCVREFLILAHTWFAFGLPSKTRCDTKALTTVEKHPTKKSTRQIKNRKIQKKQQNFFLNYRNNSPTTTVGTLNQGYPLLQYGDDIPVQLPLVAWQTTLCPATWTALGSPLKGKCALGPFLSILVIKCQHKCLDVNQCP